MSGFRFVVDDAGGDLAVTLQFGGSYAHPPDVVREVAELFVAHDLFGFVLPEKLRELFPAEDALIDALRGILFELEYRFSRSSGPEWCSDGGWTFVLLYMPPSL